MSVNMSLDLKPVNRTRVSDQVANQLLMLIQQGVLEAGQRIPSEHELSRQFATSRSTVREALAKLEYVGVLEIRSGSGAIVNEWPLNPTELTDKLSWVVERRDQVLEILQVREVIQGLCARLCAEHATQNQIDEFIASVNDMEGAMNAGDLEAVTEADTLFHTKIGDYAGNEIANDLLQRIEEAYRSSSRALMDLRGRAGASVMQHMAIVEAMKDRHPEDAEKAMRDHISSVRMDLVNLSEAEPVTTAERTA